MGFFKSLISDTVDSLKDQIVESVGEATNINLASLGKLIMASIPFLLMMTTIAIQRRSFLMDIRL